MHRGTLPFDRTIKVSLTERLTKEQIMARMPHNLRTLEHLLPRNRADFKKADQSPAHSGRSGRGAQAILRRSAQEPDVGRRVSLRTRRVQPMVRQLKEMSRRMDALRKRLDELESEPALARSSDGGWPRSCAI